MAVNINVPSQVKTYANLAAFPATGALKTIYIAEDTNKTYRWTGSVYTEISASAAMTWGAIGGTLSDQTDLNTALNAKVPTSRTLTINGVTQDLSANRTFTISTGITIGSTAIASGVVGRVLFEGAGNVVQESANFTFDTTNNQLSLLTNSNQASSFNTGLNVKNTNSTGYANTLWYNDNNDIAQFMLTGTAGAIAGTNIIARQANFINAGGTGGINLLATAGHITFLAGSGSTSKMVLFQTGNLAINTTTDAGFRLDVNGTARFTGSIIAKGANASSQAASFVQDSGSNYLGFVKRGSSESGNMGLPAGSAEIQNFSNGALGIFTESNYIALGQRNAERMRILAATGNVGINTTTDAGFRLDVNGTARFVNDVNFNASARFGDGTARITGAQIGGQGANNAVNFYFNNGSTWVDDTNVSAFSIRYNQGIRIPNTSRYPLTLGSDTKAVASAQIEMVSTTQGFLPPRMTTTQKNAIASPAAGLMVYDTTLNVISYYNGSMWI